jgi:hypothetical protein
MSADKQHQIANILGCPVASFPQTHLGLPLSVTSFLTSIDSNIDTLSTKGATKGGRLTLTKSVLSALPSHLLSSQKVPKWFLEDIDKMR